MKAVLHVFASGCSFPPFALVSMPLQSKPLPRILIFTKPGIFFSIRASLYLTLKWKKETSLWPPIIFFAMMLSKVFIPLKSEGFLSQRMLMLLAQWI